MLPLSFQSAGRSEPPQQRQYAQEQAKPQESTKKPSKPAAGGQPLEQIQAAWPAIGEWLREHRHVQVQAFIRDAQPYAIEGKTLVLAFKPTQAFHKANVEREGNQQPLRKAIRAVTSHDLEIGCILTGERAQSPKNPKQKQPSVEMEPLVKEALKLFGDM